MAKYGTNEQTLRRLEREERKEALLTKVELKAAKHLLETGQKNDEFIFEHRDRVNLIIAMIDRILKKADNGKLNMAGDKEQFVYWTKLSSYPENLQGVARSCQLLYGYADFYFTETHDHDVFKFSRNGVERLAIKYLKKVLESRHYDSLKIKYPTINELSGVSKYRPSHKALVNKLYKMIADDNILVDDGSNDDDYDEDEIVTVDNTDNDAEDDEDELVDPPIETAEVKEETKMQEIKVPEASTTTETAKFEVGKTYVLQDICYTVISRTEKTATFTHETACSKVLGLGREKTTRKAIRHDDNGNEVVYGFSTFGRLEAIMDVHTYELTNNCLRVESNNFVSYDWSNTIDVESQEVTADEEVTAENNVEIEKLEKKLASLKLFPLNNDEYMQACVYSIKKYYACIAKAEEDMWQFQLEQEKYDREVAALENAIANRKLIDATDEIVTADAVGASVAAMIEANFTAANLLEAINAQVGTAIENVPVTFELQNFAADVNISDSYATIDTAVSDTVTAPEPEDEDDIKTKEHLAEIADLDAQIAALQAQKESLVKHLEDVKNWAYDEVQKAVESMDITPIELKSALNSYSRKINCFTNHILTFAITDNTEFHVLSFGHYSTAKQFKAVIRELVAAIKRGDEKFTFPADETAGK